jgi:hypothetical protein
VRAISEYVSHAAFVEGESDAHGNPVESWGDAVSVGVYAFDPGATSEPREPGRDRVDTSPTLYLPSTVVFGARDRVTARGVLYEVEGVTRQFVHPTDADRAANVATLRAVIG